MLHLRILVPQDLTPPVEALLRREPAAVHLSVVRGAAVDPIGDLIEVDVEHAALAALISRLEDLGVARRGSFSFSDLTDARSAAAAAARTRTSSIGTEFIAWDEVVARTRDDTVVTPAYIVLMTIAGLMAGAGILANNEVLLIGAMIVSPDFGPIAGFTVASLVGPSTRVRSAAWALLLGFATAAGAGLLAAILSSLAGVVPETYLAGQRPVAELIAAPNIASLVIALAAGVAAMVGLGQARSGAVVGVVVSVTTMPAAANVGVALAFGQGDEAIGALAQLLINLAGMVGAGVATLWVGLRLSRARAIAELRSRRDGRRRAAGPADPPGD